MIIACPECSTRYMVAANSLIKRPTSGALTQKPGRKVKCLKCSHIWFQEPTEQALKDEADVSPPPIETKPTAPDKMPVKVKAKKAPIVNWPQLSTAWKVFIITFLLLMILFLMIFSMPEKMGSLWPGFEIIAQKYTGGVGSIE